MPADAKKNSQGIPYPLTSMNFMVTAGTTNSATAAFSEVSGVEASVDVVEFRQGNANSLAPVKIPGLVHHGNITLKYGYILEANFRDWVIQCTTEHRAGTATEFRRDVMIELIDIAAESLPATLPDASVGSAHVWILKDAWVTKYNGPDLNAMNSEVAVESVELAYEELVIPKGAGGA